MGRERTIVYALVAHCGGESGDRIICDYPAEGAPIYRKIATEVAASVDPSCREVVGVPRGKYVVHTLIGDLRYVAVTATPDAPGSESRVAFLSKIFLEKLRSAYGELPILVDHSRETTDLSAIDVSTPLQKILEDFNRRDVNADILLKSQEQLAQVREVLMEGARKLIDRGERLEELVRKTRTLEITVRKNFRQSTRRTSRKKKKEKKRIAIAAVVTASVVLIVTSVALTFFMTYIYIL